MLVNFGYLTSIMYKSSVVAVYFVATIFIYVFLLFYDGGPHHIETILLICRANQSKSVEWFLYDKDIVQERVKETYFCQYSISRFLGVF